MKFPHTFLLIMLLLPLLVHAHGYVPKLTVDGTLYHGPDVAGPTISSGIRQVYTIDPIKGAQNVNLTCGTVQPGETASLMLDANPGSELLLYWGTPTGNWPHNTGPMQTYMTPCGNGSCVGFDPSQALWFKIQELGLQANGSWVQSDVMYRNPTSVTLPQNIAPGDYLVRHEIIALHLAMTMGGAEFYVSCAQIRIGGHGTGVPSQDELVRLPGAYSDDDPGIYVPGIYDPGLAYVFPGPPVSKLAANGTSGSGNKPPPPTKKPKTGQGRCTLKPPALRVNGPHP